MTSCLEFRSLFHAGTNDPALLEHLRTCDACLDFAAHVDPEVMFRAIGGEMMPPGGVDDFVADVMHSIQVRSKDRSFAPKPASRWPRRFAAAAALAAGISGATLLYHSARVVPLTPSPVPMASREEISTPLTTKPAVETYSSTNATIVEIPSQRTSDTKIVMVIDDSLPADL